ncbi:MAG: hypothetical protein WCU00_06345 [Candidatus Latescibacterota bacterium]
MRKLFPLFMFLFLPFQMSVFAQAKAVTLESDSFKYEIGADGKNLSFIDKKSGKDYCDHAKPSFCAQVKKDGKSFDVSKVSADGDRISLGFAGTEITATLKNTVKNKYILLEVESVKGGESESLVFINVPLTLKGMPSDPFAACAFSLNLFTRVDQLPALQTYLRVSCYQKFGLNGAKIALIGVPQADILPTLREVLTAEAGDMPYSTIAGPWAQDSPYSHGSYLFNIGDLTEATVDDWIKKAKSGGFNQIENHGGAADFFRFGDFELNKEKFPQGWDTFKDIVAKLHEAGIASIFHTYSFFIDKHSKYVTPVPSPYLDSFRTLTLSAPISKDATEIQVNESTKGITTITGFSVYNSVVLHIGDELVTFDGVTQESPYKFTGCRRGAFDTQAAPHPQGAKARHLKETWGLFVPDVDTPLFAEIAKNHADIVNKCNFDGIYIDAIDGASILRGGPDSWYYADKFIFEIAKNLKKPVGMEMSDMTPHWWQFRPRWQAWDYQIRGHKRYLDMHISSVNKGLLLPLQVGWWNFQVFDPPQVDRTFSDDTEYLGCKLIGYDAGYSLQSFNRSSFSKPTFQRSLALMKKYEDIRHAHTIDESVKAQLRQPGKEFTLFTDSQGRDRFKPAFYNVHKVEGVKHPSSSWQTENSFGSQPVKLRIEALMSAAPYDSPNGITIVDFTKPDVFGQERKAANGLIFDFKTTTEQVKSGGASGVLSIKSSGKTPRNASWARLGKKFQPILNLSKNKAFGVWVYGDGQGEILNFRLDSPFSVSSGAVADRYLDIDFTGWRYCELVETESSRYFDYAWNENTWFGNVYQRAIDFSRIESFSLLMNNVPAGKDIRCIVSPIKALPMVKTTLRNPSITVGGKKIVFPVEMTSGSYIEYFSLDDCKLYGSDGALIATVKPQGAAPVLVSGKNKVIFSCTGQAGFTPRANVTIIGYGEPL